MNLQQELFRGYLDDYALDIKEVAQTEGGWRVSTDKGDKRLLYCRDVNLLRWSHHWREKLVADGLRHVERYMVTKTGKHWIEDNIGCFALSDWWEGGKEWPDEKEIRMNGYKTAGIFLGSIHRSADLEQEMYRGRYRRKGTINQTELQKNMHLIHGLIQDISREKPASEQKWFAYNLSCVEERTNKAQTFYFASGAEADCIPLSFVFIDLSCFVYWEEDWYITGLHNCVLVPRHEDTLSLLQQILEKEEGIGGIRAFLDGYFSVRAMPESERTYLLALLSYPGSILASLEDCQSPGSLLADERERLLLEMARQTEKEAIFACIKEWDVLSGEESV
ncbi:hypothetical protein [Aneurinibacillus tyrosinisolvens]|uniref:hypothetical protein n=1 Tax=Aneurinibacillus tyrosinisolvens TaxID=1443435 RepID=UPI00063F52F8|nr:hypothetical protein [Aneurinibacillus tyrosinisolvens]